MTIELSEYVIDAIADAVVKKMQEPSYNSIKTELEPCDDAISRQAVLDCQHFIYDETGEELEVILAENVLNLPPVTP